MNKRRTLCALVLIVSLGVWVVACGAGETESSVIGTSATTQVQVTTTLTPTTDAELRGAPQLVSVLWGALVPEMQAQHAEIVVYGTVSKIDPGQWCSPDGRGPTPTDKMDVVIYHTFYVDPIEILKGSPRFGTPIAFILVGGIEGEVSSPLRVGDRVLVSGLVYEDLYDNVYWRKDAYFSLSMEFSIFLFDGATFTNLANPETTTVRGFKVNGFTLDEARARIAAAIAETK